MKRFLFIVVITIMGTAIAIYQYNYGEYIVLNPNVEGYTEFYIYDENRDVDNYESNKDYIIGISADENMIDNEETALEIGKAILKEHYPKAYKNMKKNIRVKEDGDNWIVYEEIKVSRSYLKKYTLKDGETFVIFSKKNGKVLMIS